MRAMIVCIIIVFFVINENVECSSSRLSRIEERLNIIEIRQDSESKFRREDARTIFDKLGDIETMLNTSGQLNQYHGNKPEIDMETETEITTYMDALSNRVNYLNESVKHIVKAFKDEKESNSRIRRQIPEINSRLTTIGEKSENTENCVRNASQEIVHLKDILTILQKRTIENSASILKIESAIFDELKKQSALILNMSEELKIQSASILKIETAVSEEFKMQNASMLKIKNADSEELKKQGASILKIETSVTELTEQIEIVSMAIPVKTSCLELYSSGYTVSGVYVVKIGTQKPIRVYCDQETDGGGWTVFQRRQDGTVDFYRDWENYKLGFGNVEGEFWLGNAYLSSLIGNHDHELRMELEDFEGNRKFAKYSQFKVGTETEDYVLTVSGYSGNAGDSLSSHSNSKFTTKDRDNDERSYRNCAEQFKGAWWYSDCHRSNLNGLYLRGKHTSDSDGVNWYHWLGYKYSLKFVEMKFR